MELFGDDDYLYFCVKDYGDGIDEEKLPFILDRFYRCDESRSTHGFGLGLSIVKSIVQIHGATLQIKNHSEGGILSTIKINKTQN